METRETDWGSLAPELLTLVLQRVQEGAGNRGEGRRVVALAGVCRSWRRSVHQELHRQPPSLLTSPASTREPAPCGSHLQCVVKKTGDTFRLFQVVSGNEYFLLGARKKYTIGSSYFRISTDPRILWTQGHDEAVSVTSNFWRTAFTLQEPSAKSAKPGSKTILSLKYDEAAIDGNCLRTMRCKKLGIAGRNVNGEGGWWSSWLTTMLKWNHLLNFSDPVNHSYKLLKNCAALSSSRSPDPVKKFRSRSVNERMFSLRNKDPEWQEQEQCWSLDFIGRASILASIHNFQLVSSDSGDGRVILQLGKLCKGLFVLDFGAPLSALDAFAISLSSFATSVGLDT